MYGLKDGHKTYCIGSQIYLYFVTYSPYRRIIQIEVHKDRLLFNPRFDLDLFYRILEGSYYKTLTEFLCRGKWGNSALWVILRCHFLRGVVDTKLLISVLHSYRQWKPRHCEYTPF